MVGARAEGLDVDVAREDRVLEVVHRVGDVVREVHDLGLDAAHALGGALAHPGEGGLVVVVEAELGATRGVGHRAGVRPGILAARVEARPREVQAVGALIVAEDLRLEAGEQPEGLGVALETSDARRPRVERALAVVPERRVPDVVGEAGRVDDVGVEVEARREARGRSAPPRASG